MSAFCLNFAFLAQAQEVYATFQKKEIALNEPLILVLHWDLRQAIEEVVFPAIEGFKQRNQMRFHKEEFVQGISKPIEIIQQHYYPYHEGNQNIPPLKIKINNIYVETEATLIKVLPFDANKANTPENIFENLYYTKQNLSPEEVKEEAFLGVFTNKEEVFVGESFTLWLAFYVSTTNRAFMEFTEVATQLAEIVKKIKPQNCWEENFDLQQIREDTVSTYINGKYYKKYKLYQATFYPLSVEPVQIPAVGLKMIKYKFRLEAKPELSPENKQTETKQFYSQPLRVKVKPLPLHPLSSRVAVGTLYLREEFPLKILKTGENFSYKLIISGEANFNTLPAPEILSSPHFEFFSPQKQLYSYKTENIMLNTKTFVYNIIPKKAGSYALKNYCRFIFFNVLTQRYDTLRPQAVVQVSGETILGDKSTEEQSIYKMQATEQEYAQGFRKQQGYYLQIGLGVAAVLSLFLWFLGKLVQ